MQERRVPRVAANPHPLGFELLEKFLSIREVTCWYQWTLCSLQRKVTAILHACLLKLLNQPLNGFWKPPPRSQSLWRSCSDDCKAIVHILNDSSQRLSMTKKRNFLRHSFQKPQVSLEKNHQIMSTYTMFSWKHCMPSFPWWNCKSTFLKFSRVLRVLDITKDLFTTVYPGT